MIFRHLSGFQITGTSVSKNNKVLITSEGLLGCSSLLNHCQYCNDCIAQYLKSALWKDGMKL